MSKLLCSLTALFLAVPALFSQTMRLEDIMKGEEFTGFSPQNIRWTLDNQSVVFDWNPDKEPGRSPYSYRLTEKKTVKVPVLNGHYSSEPLAERQVPQIPVYYFIEDGNLFRYQVKTKAKTLIYSGTDPVEEVFHLQKPGTIYFMLRSNVYAYNEQNGSMVQVTNFIQGGKPSEKKDSSFLTEQQKELFSYIRRQNEQRDWYRKQPERKLPGGIYYAKSEYLSRVSVSSDGRFITFVLTTDSETPNTHYEAYITQDGFTQTRQARPKVSEREPATRMGIFDIQKDSVYFVTSSSLSDIRKKPAYLETYGVSGLYSEDRAICFHQAVMNPEKPTALVDIRAFDNKDRWICLLDLQSGILTEQDHQHDEAWIGGPGISEWNEAEGTLAWVNTDEFFFQSEVSGYSHLYAMKTGAKDKKALTNGNWEVRECFLSRNKNVIYFIANKIHPGVRNGYKLDLKSGQITPIFEGLFGIEWTLSPDEKTWAVRYSTATTPWELCIAPNLPNQQLIPITHSSPPEFSKLQLQSPEIIRIPSSDGKTIYSRIYKPEKSNGAAVLFVHGAGYLQNAHYYWSYYQREMLFHQLLAQKGYTILDVDYRASEGYGRNWRTDIYRDMGNRDLKDYIDAKSFLVQHFGIDSGRVGMYGGSYGGFITLMGLLKTPDAFACGAALRAVTDWAHYNHEYTSNILNYPATDPIAYKRSSPIYFAENLKKPLLMLHGMVDDNVQFQDIVRLNQRLIELGKTTFQLSVYPTEAHGFTFTPAWVDEYRRILELFEQNLAGSGQH